jgi:ABC-2 type transport system ATP-binding protein
MKPNNVIEVKEVKKKFKVYFDKGSSLKEKIIFKERNKYEDRWVLKGISFEVKKGEAIGLIGKNGCGKSTTLKLLTRIMYPNEGNIEINGRVSSLLELGAGFHPDMSGRENIYTNASIFGLNRKEIDARMDNIVKFSELEEFLDNPVRTYSSGMYMRLAFSIAINVDADVLLIDEILAVGDISFQTKCFEKMKEIKSQGTTIVIVSHSMGQIEQICDRAIWIEDGLIKEDGIPKFVGEHYLALMEGKRLEKKEEEYQKNLVKLKQENHEILHHDQKCEERQIISKIESDLPTFCGPRAVRSGSKEVEFTGVQMLNRYGMETMIFNTGEEIVIKMQYKCHTKDLQTNFTIGITRDDGLYCYGSSVLLDSNEVCIAKKEGEVKIIIEYNRLLPGKYFLDIGAQAKDYLPFDTICSIMEFQVTAPVINEFGILSIEHRWEVDGQTIQINN